jgi:hypothetical protein
VQIDYIARKWSIARRRRYSEPATTRSFAPRRSIDPAGGCVTGRAFRFRALRCGGPSADASSSKRASQEPSGDARSSSQAVIAGRRRRLLLRRQRGSQARGGLLASVVVVIVEEEQRGRLGCRPRSFRLLRRAATYWLATSRRYHGHPACANSSPPASAASPAVRGLRLLQGRRHRRVRRRHVRAGSGTWATPVPGFAVPSRWSERPRTRGVQPAASGGRPSAFAAQPEPHQTSFRWGSYDARPSVREPLPGPQ